jgi:hypothetical protein
MRTTAHVHDDARQRFIHWKKEESVALDAHFFPQRFFESLTQHQADILDRVVIVDVRVAFGVNRQIEQPVLRKQGEHVVEKGYARFDLRHAAPINGKSKRDVGLRSFAGDSRYTLGIS